MEVSDELVILLAVAAIELAALVLPCQ